MSLADFLGTLGMSMPGPITGFGGGTFGMDGRQVPNMEGGDPYSGGVQQQAGMPAQPTAPTTSQPAPPVMPQRRGGVWDFLGQIGDALLAGAGGQPIYSKKKEQEQLGEALSQFIGTQDPRLAEFIRTNPAVGMQLYNASREDKRFDRTAGQDDRRIGVSEGQLGLGRDELGERQRSNMAGEGITTRGQDMTATTQVRLQQMRSNEAAAGRAHAAALRSGDRAHAERMLGLQQQYKREIAAMGGDGAYEETVTETPGTEAVDGWFSNTPATPSTKTVVRRPISQKAEPAGVSQADLEYTAKKHGISVDEVKRRLGQK